MNYTAKQIAAMIRANVAAVDSGKITWEQFGIVNSATWDLATRGEQCIVGSKASHRSIQVSKELAKY